MLVSDVLMMTGELQTCNPVPRLAKSQVPAFCRARPVCTHHTWFMSRRASQVVLVARNPPANAGDVRDCGFDHWVGKIPGSGRSPRGGHGDPLQDSCLERPMDRGAWRATVHGVAKSQT